MLRRFLYLAIAFALTASPAFAIPGQTRAQLAAWGKANAALHAFHASMDEETGGTNYVATVTIDGQDGDFNAEPEGGIVHREYVAFHNVDTLNAHAALIRDTLARIYGESVAADFMNAARLPHKGRAVAWQGKKLAYVAFGSALFVERLADLPDVIHNLRACDALDCSD